MYSTIQDIKISKNIETLLQQSGPSTIDNDSNVVVVDSGDEDEAPSSSTIYISTSREKKAFGGRCT